MPESDAAASAADVDALLATLAARPGHRDGEVGRCTDDPGLWALVTRWDGVGAHRRALSAADVEDRRRAGVDARPRRARGPRRRPTGRPRPRAERS